MTVPIAALVERSSAYVAGNSRQVKDRAISDQTRNRFSQCLARAANTQKTREVKDNNNNGQTSSKMNETNKSNQKKSSSETMEQPTASQECHDKDNGSPVDLTTKPEGTEEKQDLPDDKVITNNKSTVDVETMVIPVVAIQPTFVSTVASKPEAVTAKGAEPETAVTRQVGVAAIQSASPAAVASQPEAEQSKDTESEVVSVTLSPSGKSVEKDNLENNTAKLEENSNSSGVQTALAADEPRLEPNVVTAKDGMKTDSQVQQQAVILETIVPEVKENSKKSEAKADKNQTNITSAKEKLQADNGQTDVKKIIAIESHIRPVHTETAKSTGEEINKSNQSETEQDTPKFNLLLNQTATVQVGETATKRVEPALKEQIDQEDLIQQIVKKAEVMLKSDISEMKIQLKPDFLGKMMIKVTVEDGAVVAKIITENQHVKQVLEANLNSLRQNLEANGMKVEKTEVSVQLFNDSRGGFNGSDSNRYPQWSEQQGQNRHSLTESGYGLAGVENMPELTEDPIHYGIGSDGQVNYLI